MKFILGIILTVIVIFFVWNILKRIFFKTFYTFPKPTGNSGKQTSSQEKIKSGNHGLNWDAETVDYEEVKEEKKTNS